MEYGNVQFDSVESDYVKNTASINEGNESSGINAKYSTIENKNVSTDTALKEANSVRPEEQPVIPTESGYPKDTTVEKTNMLEKVDSNYNYWCHQCNKKLCTI